MVEPCAEKRRSKRSNGHVLWVLLGTAGMAGISILGSCSRGPDETESVERAATITRVANTTLQMPSDPGTTYSLQTAFPNVTLAAPVAMATPPGETNRLFVVERAGRIKVLSNLSATTPTVGTFLDISARPIPVKGEQGLLGLAFHPNYASNGFFYVFYSTTQTGSNTERVSRFKVSANANVADPNSEQILIDQVDRETNHNGGDLHFGPDGYLYISLGDEGNQNDFWANAQHIDLNFFSGILRIDVDKKAGSLAPNANAAVKAGTYTVPSDNPFVGATTFNGLAVTPSKVRTEFWAVGLRNPWRFHFDSANGQLWVGDVGQDAHEEIDIITKGGNYGWSFREGFSAGPKAKPGTAVAIDPVWDYDHTLGKSITGGVVSRGSNLPELVGKYLFADYVSGNIWYLQNDAAGYKSVKIGVDVGTNAFGVDPRNGDVLLSNLGGNTIKRLVRNTSTSVIPAKLSQTGAFSNLATLTPNAGIVGYAPQIPFWSDYAIKTRWFSIPNVNSKMTFATDSNWTLPAGTVWIKHFDLETDRGNPASRRRIETRFLVRNADGVYGVTYKWNAAQTDADLVADEGLSEDIPVTVNGTATTQTWRYPSRADCATCHNAPAGFALSFTTRQLNSNFDYGTGPANQLATLSSAGYFTAAVPNPSTLPVLYPAADTTATLENRARSYLQVNCSQCHQPGAPGQGTWNALFSVALNSAGIINGALLSNGGDPANKVIVPQDVGHSMILRRMQNLPNASRMPPIGSNELDQASITLLSDWVMSVPVPTSFEAENLTATGTAAIAPQTDANTSGGKWVQLSATAVGQTIDFTGFSLPAGTFTVKFKYKTNNNRAQSSLKIDGTQVGGTIEQYATPVGYPETTLGNVTFASAGSHTIRLTVLGKNSASSGFAVSADLFTFTAVGPPPPPPAAPSNLIAMGSVGQASLTWTDNASNETGFKVERKVQGAADSTYTVVGTPGVNAQAFTNNVVAGSYTYRVKATNANGDSTASNTADATVTAPPPPATPSNLIAMGSVGQASLTWTDNASNETGFKVERKVQGAADSTYAVVGTPGVNAQAFTDSVAAGSYTYRVKATNANGDSTPSNTADATVTTPPPPVAPSNLVAMGSVGQASLTWTDNASNETGFKVERKVQGAADSTYAVAGTPAVNAQAFTDSVAAGSYTYRVKATNSNGDSTPSNTADATVTVPTVGISNLVVNDNLPAGCVSPNCSKDKWAIQSNFQVGAVSFGDRTYTVDSVGNSAILGGPWIRTAADSKNYASNPLATFTANGSFVYLVIDDRWNGTTGRPSWLTDAAFTDQGYNVVVRQSSTQTFPYSVWRKAITSGSTVNLPALGGSTAPAYFVIVK
jgi:uncharacterized repeat protein (TIGR03806 family)